MKAKIKQTNNKFLVKQGGRVVKVCTTFKKAYNTMMKINSRLNPDEITNKHLNIFN